MSIMAMKWLPGHGLLHAFLSGNGKEERLRRAEIAAKVAEARCLQATEEALVQTARLTEDTAIMAFGDDSGIDIPAIRAEVEAELQCPPVSTECQDCGHKPDKCGALELVAKKANEAA